MRALIERANAAAGARQQPAVTPPDQFVSEFYHPYAGQAQAPPKLTPPPNVISVQADATDKANPPPPPPGYVPPSQQSQNFIARLAGPIGQLSSSMYQYFQKQFQGGKKSAKARGKKSRKPGASKYGPGNRGGGKDSGKRPSSMLGSFLTSTFTKVTAALAPMAIIGAALNSNTSGFRIFLSSVNLLGSALGMVLTPIFIGMAAVMGALSEEISERLLPHMKEWYTTVLEGFKVAVDKGTKAFDMLSEASTIAIENLNSFGHDLSEFYARYVQKDEGKADAIAQQRDRSEEEANKRRAARADEIEEKKFRAKFTDAEWEEREKTKDVIAERARKMHEAARAKNPALAGAKQLGSDYGGGEWDGDGPGTKASGSKEGFGDKFTKWLGLASEQFRRSVAPNAQQTSLTGASRAAQMAAFNMSPFEAASLKWGMATAQGIQEVVAGIKGLGMY